MAVTYTEMAYFGLPFAALCLATTAITYRLPIFSALEHQKRLFCALCCASLVSSSIVTWPALQAMYEMMTSSYTLACGGTTTNALLMPAPAAAVLSCGMTCGYFVQDSLIMLIFPKETKKELGGATAYKIMWMHHIVSLFVWPYSMVNSKAALFVVYFLATELTNIGQNLFLLAQRGNVFGSGVDLYIGLVWALSFFVVRVLPVPIILYAWAYLHFLTPGGCGMSTPEYVVSMVTVPIPVMLNLFWFYKIVSKAQRMMGGDKKKAK